MALDWVSSLPVHWVDEIENKRPEYAELESIPEWMSVDLPDGSEDIPSYGTRAVVEHILDHRSSYDYDEFDRQLGVILSNEAQWINQAVDSAVIQGVDKDEIDQSYDQERMSFVGLVTMIEDRGFNVPTRGYEAMESLNADGYMTREYGSFGRKFTRSVVNDISRERVMSGRVSVPDDLGIDFTRSADISPELARSLTSSYDLERMAERSAQLRTSLRQELDSITGPVDENSELARSIDDSRINVREAVDEDAPKIAPEVVRPRPVVSDSIEELIEEIDAREERNKGTDSPSL